MSPGAWWTVFAICLCRIMFHSQTAVWLCSDGRRNEDRQDLLNKTCNVFRFTASCKNLILAWCDKYEQKTRSAGLNACTENENKVLIYIAYMCLSKFHEYLIKHVDTSWVNALNIVCIDISQIPNVILVAYMLTKG